MSKYITEVCAGTITDCLNASIAGANRIELVQGTFMGGLTPSLGLVKEALKKVNIPIIAMVRSRGGGFNYNQDEIDNMLLDAKLMLDEGVAGIAFGFLNKDYSIDIENTKKMVDLIHSYNKEAVYHRAYDLSVDLDSTTKLLIDLKVDRILTSGGEPNVKTGLDKLKYLSNKYGDKIEFLAGSGLNEGNVIEIINNTNIKQFHATFKSWDEDLTTTNEKMTYRYSNDGDFEVTDVNKVKSFINVINAL